MSIYPVMSPFRFYARFCAFIFICIGVAAPTARADASWGAAWATQAPPALPILLKATEEARAAAPDALAAEGRTEKVFVTAKRPATEWTAWRLAHVYRLSGDKAAAARAAALIAGLAGRPFPEVPAEIHAEGKLIPFPAVIAFGLLRDAPVWRETSAGPDAPERARVEAWLREYAKAFQAVLDRPGQVTNYTPFGLRHAASLALVLGDRDLLLRCEAVAGRLAYDPDFWHADLIWQEGTVSYARQVTGNLKGLLPMLRAGAESGLAAVDEAGLDRLAGRLGEIDAAQALFTMPGGRAIPVNDTHWAVPPEATPRAPRSLVYPDFGHYALGGADMETHLSAPVLTGGGRYGGGHYHDSRLSLQLWAHGEEVLPDAGYPFQPKNHRYFHMSPLAHNVAVADTPRLTRDKGDYGIWGGHWARTAVFGYDDGAASGGRVGYVAAASPGPAGEGVTRSERVLLQVATGAWSGYVLDAFWLQGGKIHETYLRQTEDEAATQAVSAPLVAAGETMAAVLGESTDGDQAWRAVLREPMRVDTRGDFDVTWTGEESGVGMRLFFAPQEGSTTWLSRMPRVRPTAQDPAKRDDFPGWHLYRRRTVAATQTTVWAGVYEPVARDAKPRVRAVRWERSSDGAGLLVRVELEGRTDVWVMGGAGREVAVDGHSLRGRAAGYSTAETGEAWSWAAAGTALKRPGATGLVGAESAALRVTRLSGGRLVVAGAMARPAAGWVALRFADGSGRAVRVGEVRADASGAAAGETVFEVIGDPGMEIDAAGMRRTAFPLHAVPGAVSVEPLGAVFELMAK